MAWMSWRSRRPRLPAPVVDAGLAVALALAVTVAINVSPPQGEPPDAPAYGLGLVFAALPLLRRSPTAGRPPRRPRLRAGAGDRRPDPAPAALASGGAAGLRGDPALLHQFDY